MHKSINIDKTALGELCRRHRIKRLSLFGSVLKDNFTDDSDIDVLVEFEAGHTPGFSFFIIQDELTELIGRRVDLNTPQFLSRYFREKVIEEAQVEYAA